MAKKLSYERYCWFDGHARAMKHPNARTLAERFEISQKQAQRDIEFMRDRLGAPLMFKPLRKGYEYEHVNYELPPVWLTEEELLAFCLALRLSAAIPDNELKSFLRQLLEKFLTFRSLDASRSLREIAEKVSVKNIGYYKVDESVFHRAVGALFRNQALKITYHSPHKDERTERIIQPLHLLCYMGSWHLIAFCTLRGMLRDFALSRIQSIEPEGRKVEIPPSLPPVKDYLRKNFGIISGESSVDVVLRFVPEVSGWIAEQIWHDCQQISMTADGSLHLAFPVSDFKEVCREILKYGACVEVLEPKALRDEVRAEIEKMNSVYR